MNNPTATAAVKSRPTQKAVLPTVTKKPTEEIVVISSETIASASSEKPEKIVVEILDIEAEEKKKSSGTIYDAVAAGADFYSKPEKDKDNYIRWLTNGTHVEILNGPTLRNNFEWYEIYSEQYDRTGWVLSKSVKIDY